MPFQKLFTRYCRRRKMAALLICCIVVTAVHLLFQGISITAMYKQDASRYDTSSHTEKTHLDVQYIINNSNACLSNRTYDIIVLVFSAPHHFVERHEVRETWGNKDLFQAAKVKVVFMLGFPARKELQVNILDESKTFGDIVQGNYIDLPGNLIIKSISSITWILKFCQNVNFVLKSNDNVLINMYGLMHLMKSNYPTEQRALYCSVRTENVHQSNQHLPKIKGHRKASSIYCESPVWIVTRDLIEDFHTIMRTHYQVYTLPLEHIYTTGVVPYFAGNVKFVNVKEFYVKNQNMGYKTYNTMDTLPIVSVPERSIYRNMWYAMLCKLSITDIYRIGGNIEYFKLILFKDFTC